jgi:hypothetical protein
MKREVRKEEAMKRPRNSKGSLNKTCGERKEENPDKRQKNIVECFECCHQGRGENEGGKKSAPKKKR